MTHAHKVGVYLTEVIMESGQRLEVHPPILIKVMIVATKVRTFPALSVPPLIFGTLLLDVSVAVVPAMSDISPRIGLLPLTANIWYTD